MIRLPDHFCRDDTLVFHISGSRCTVGGDNLIAGSDAGRTVRQTSLPIRTGRSSNMIPAFCRGERMTDGCIKRTGTDTYRWNIRNGDVAAGREKSPAQIFFRSHTENCCILRIGTCASKEPDNRLSDRFPVLRTNAAQEPASVHSFQFPVIDFRVPPIVFGAGFRFL